MSNLIDSRIVIGPDDSLAAKDVHSVTDNNITGSGGAKVNESKSKIDGEVKVPEKPVIPPPESEESEDSGSSSPSSAPPPVTKERLNKELSNLPPESQELLSGLINGQADGEDVLSQVQKDIVSMSGLSDNNSREIDLTDKIIKGVVGEDGPMPNTDCNYLSSMFGGSGSDFGANILLNLMLLAKMIECGFVDKVNELLETIDNPIVKKAVGIMGVGALFSEKAVGILSDKFSSGDSNLIEENPFETLLNNPKEKVSKNLDFSIPKKPLPFNPTKFNNDLEDVELSLSEKQSIKSMGNTDYSRVLEPFKSNSVDNTSSPRLTVNNMTSGANSLIPSSNNLTSNPINLNTGISNLTPAPNSLTLNANGTTLPAGDSSLNLNSGNSINPMSSTGYTPLDLEPSRSNIKPGLMEPTVEDGVDLKALNDLLSTTDGNEIKDVYPDLNEYIVRSYRLPINKEIDYEEEYTGVVNILEKVDPYTFKSWRHDYWVTNTRLFAKASFSLLKLFTTANNSEYKAEVMLARSYYYNNAISLLENQFSSVKIKRA